MVLERLITIKAAERNPFAMFLIGALVSIVCLVVSFIVFNESIGMFTAFLITITMTPFMVRLHRAEEEETDMEVSRRVGNCLSRHKDILTIYTAFFLGVILSLSIIYIMLPAEVVQDIFSDQINEINIIRGNFAEFGTFQRIIVNNLGVFMLAFLFSFLFGAGAIFILSWNASVLAAAIGMATASLGGAHTFPIAALIFFPHGSLEILAYFIAAISGGLVSAAISKKFSRNFFEVIKDVSLFMMVAVILLFVGGIIEAVQI